MKPDAFGVEVKCTGCTIRRTYQDRDEIPEKYRDGCPNCGSVLAITQIGN